MSRYLLIISLLFFAVFFLSFSITTPTSASQNVKKLYAKKIDTLITEIKILQIAVNAGHEKIFRSKFLKARAAYKKVEVIVEYFFHSYANILNGPPIPFFEETEPYISVNEPYGFQVIEELIFSGNYIKNTVVLKFQVDELLKHTVELSTANEPFEFNNANIFDAFIEQAYRITALGLTGFDSQTAQNALPECISSLKGLQEFISLYKSSFEESLPDKYQNLNKLFDDAFLFINKHNQFEKFDRLHFITSYLNPITKIIGEYKIAFNLSDNPSGGYYSAIKKNNTLFNHEGFNQYRFLGDFTYTPQKAEFGRQLFFEPLLSSNNKQSCGSCHQPNKAFTDGLKTSEALDGHSSLNRNAPTIWNAALQRNLFYDSRSRSLEDQVLQVLNNSKEMHGSATAVADKILQVEKYKQMYSDAYPNSKEEDAVSNICNAIASYERTLIALNSKFDKHMNGSALLNENEIKGFNLFMGKAKCGSCHFMPLFSGAKPPRYYYIESEVIGVPSSKNKKRPELDSDSGRYLITQSSLHLFSFKTPTLRNVALTAPYMHNGVFITLEDVVDFYNNGGGKGLGIAPKNQTLPFEKLNLSKREKKDIVAFMKTLTDTTSVLITSD